MAEIFTGAVAVCALWASTIGQPKLVDWPLRMFAFSLALTLASALF